MCIEEEIRKVRHATVLPRSAGTEFSCLAFATTCAMHFSNMSVISRTIQNTRFYSASQPIVVILFLLHKMKRKSPDVRVFQILTFLAERRISVS
jgi:hypothetical protein